MNFTRRQHKGSIALFDMTPMIDVVLQLIIFFMYTSSFAQMSRTPIDLPEEPGDKAERLAPETVTIDIDARGQLLVEGEPLSLDEIARFVQLEIDSAPDDPDAVGVLIRPDRSLPSGAVNRIAQRLTELGVRRWKVATSVPPGVGP